MKSAGFLILCLSCRFVTNSLFNLFSSKLLNSVGFTIFWDHINTYNKVSRKPAKIETKNKSVTFVRPILCTFQYLISSCNKLMLFDFLYIDAIGYWLHLGDFYSSSSCLGVFLIHDERSKHLVKP